jgi:hypothetical protein
MTSDTDPRDSIAGLLQEAGVQGKLDMLVGDDSVGRKVTTFKPLVLSFIAAKVFGVCPNDVSPV